MEDSAGLTYFVWDKGGLNLLAEKDASGNVTAEYIHGYSPVTGIGSLVAAKKTVGETAYYQYPQYDHRGTVVGLTDKTGAVIASYEYNAFGEPLVAEESTDVQAAGNRFRYQSNWMTLKDSGDRFYLSAARVYDAKTGRFLQRDPLFSGQFLAHSFAFKNQRFADNDYHMAPKNNYDYGELIYHNSSTNLYGYVMCNPIHKIDLYGLSGITVEFQDCGEDQKESVNKLLPDINSAIGEMTKDFGDFATAIFSGNTRKYKNSIEKANAIAKRWFGLKKFNLGLILSVSGLVEAYEKGRKITIECECDDDDTYGYVYTTVFGDIWNTNIHLNCLTFNENSMRLARTIIHEITHKYMNTKDYGYYVFPASKMMAPSDGWYNSEDDIIDLTSSQLSNNADTWAAMILSEFY